jgi:predicted nucleotide-binding protein (sugar kinase/HSP70/actin superfamily)
LLMSPGQRDEQSKCWPALIFRGTGKCIKVQETAQYHTEVDILLAAKCMGGC